MIKKIFNVLIKNLDRVRKILHGFFLITGFFIFVSLVTPLTQDILEKSFLVIDLNGTLVDQLEGNPLDRAIDEFMGEGQSEILVDDVVNSLNYALQDNRIQTVILKLDNFAYGGFSKLERIGAVLDNITQNGKEVIAYSEFYNRSSYYLAARSSRVLLHPQGVVLPQGFSFYSNYFKDLIDKVKIEFNIFRVGSYKSAVEPFVRNDMSDETKQSRLRVSEKLWKKYENDVLKSRGLPSEALSKFSEDLSDITKIANSSIASIALSNKVVDELITYNDLYIDIQDNYNIGTDDFDKHLVAFDSYLADMDLNSYDSTGEDNIGIIVASGQILDGKQPPGSIGDESLVSLIKKANDDESIKALVLRVDSPGGSAFASDEILNQLLKFKETGKPLVVSMGSVAASGGYWIAMAADKIYASETSITGSIGIFALLPTIQDSLAEIGIYTDGLETNKWSSGFRLDRKLPPHLRQLIQSQLNFGYNDFVSKVAMYRGIPKAEVEKIANGQIWTGMEALDNGLIDEIGNLDSAIKEAVSLSSLSDTNYGIITLENEMDSTQLITKSIITSLSKIKINDNRSFTKNNTLKDLDIYLEKIVGLLSAFNDPKAIYAFCFCDDF